MNFIVVAIATIASAILVVGLPRSIEDKIIGGVDAPIGRYPFQVSLRIKASNGHFCGGTIINKQWVLTAAHCISTINESEVIVVAGTNQLNSSNGQVYNVTKLVVNKNFNWDRTGNDTGVLKINGNFNFSNPLIQPVQLGSNYVFGNVNVTAVGWGIYLNGLLPNNLQNINMTSVSHQNCITQLNVSNTEICVTSGYGSGVCNGDSGGPIVLAKSNIQVGIASWVAGCAGALPDVFTRVSNYTSWIYNNTDGWNSTYEFNHDFYDY